MLDASDAAHPAAGMTPLSAPNDLQAFWMPFTANRAFKANPRMIARAKDNHYYTGCDGGPLVLQCRPLPRAGGGGYPACRRHA
jgi:hypothetical protein